MEKLVAIISSIGDLFQSVSDGIVNIFGFLTSILGFIRYAGKTLLVGVWKLILYIFEGGVFININRAFVQISDYIGGPATIFLSALLFIIIVRIIIAFVFKLLRMRIDYSKDKSQIDFYNKHERLK